MSDALIRADHLCKQFRRGEHVDSLRDLIARAWTRRGRRASTNDFYAIDDVSFEIHPGECFGIIGPNGAGKSTLLKLLAGILKPDAGTLETRGRVSALIELGAGFHPDLTGRENIFLNAVLLGMPRREARRKFDEIVAFAGIGDFLDTPIKRYSSGMHARLGFAIAAHVDAQILLVDEVLSVGDRAFRARCLDKMQEFLRRGVSIVFVSHDLGSVGRFCHRALVLADGRTTFVGPATAAIGRYYGACAESVLLKGPAGARVVRIERLAIRNRLGRPMTRVRPGDRLRFEFEAAFGVDIPRPSYGLYLTRLEDHLMLFETSSTRLNVHAPPAARGDRQRVRYEFRINVPPGEYAIGLHVRDRDATLYAAEEAYAARLFVEGDALSTGPVHVAPTVDVRSLSRELALPQGV
ncbi:MAG: ABC transporter ATP-binding protein [Phycisphaerae bacterium]|nr:ABC transporter ATP-binding protein [Phycisphaerae bacterium]